jgi:hypothetical protein
VVAGTGRDLLEQGGLVERPLPRLAGPGQSSLSSAPHRMWPAAPADVELVHLVDRDAVNELHLMRWVGGDRAVVVGLGQGPAFRREHPAEQAVQPAEQVSSLVGLHLQRGGTQHPPAGLGRGVRRGGVNQAEQTRLGHDLDRGLERDGLAVVVCFDAADRQHVGIVPQARLNRAGVAEACQLEPRQLILAGRRGHADPVREAAERPGLSLQGASSEVAE